MSKSIIILQNSRVVDMWLYTIVVILAVGLSLFDLNKENGGLKAAFVLLTAFLGLRYMYGSDYPAYMELFYMYNNDGIPFWDIVAIMNSDIYGEIGWQVLNKLFKPFGFWGLNLALAFFENFVIYQLVKRHVPTKWYWLSIVIYMFNTRFFLIGACSMGRQWLAVCVFICATIFIEKRKIIPYLLVVLLAASFHKSALVLLPFYFICYINKLEFKTYQAVILILILFIWNTLAQNFINPLFDVFLEEDMVFSDFARYADRDVTTEQFSIIGLISDLFLSYFFPFIGLLYYSCLGNILKKFLILYVFALLVKPLGLVIPMVVRMDYFFIIFSICLVPRFLSILEKRNNIFSLLSAIMILLIYIRQTMVFLTDSAWSRSYIYKTILSQPWV